VSPGANPGALPPVAGWRLHIGAHKTATTHLQDVLEALRPPLAAAGVDFIPRERSRHLHLHAHAGRLGWRLWLGGAAMRRKIDARVGPLRSGPPVVAISDENMPGLATALLGGDFYPAAERRLRPFAALARGPAPLAVFLSVRDPAGLLPSAYAQVLRSRPVPGGFGPIRERALARPPRWSDLVARVRRALPGVPLRVWTYEDYRHHDRAILSAFCGTALPPLPVLPPPASTRAPSAEAMARIEALDPGLGPAAHAAAVAAIAAADGGGPRFAPFAPAEAALLGEAYAEDLARLEADAPGTLLRFA
jgi:hypothetical protein